MSADRALVRLAVRSSLRGALAWGVVIGATAGSSAAAYVKAFPDAASRAQLAATTGHDAGLSVLLGSTADIGTVGGYTVYKGFTFLTTIAALWALFAATRLLRGEEDAGRWALVLAGGTRPGRATAATLAGLAAAVALMTLVAAATLAAVGRDASVAIGPAAALRYALSITVVAAVFAGVGALAAQLASDRRTANGLGAVVLVVATVLRMIGDAGTATRWVRWTTPLGWAEAVAPLTRPSPLALVPGLVAAVALAATAVVVAGRRDVGHGVLARHGRPAPPSHLTSTLGFSWHLERTALVAWTLALAASGALLGALAQLTLRPVPGSMGDLLEDLGASGSFAQQYFGVVTLLLATVVALLPAGQLGAAADEERAGRLVHLLVAPVHRARWLGERLGLAAAAIAAGGVLAGVAMWGAARIVGVSAGAADLLGAGASVVPPAWAVLGVGAAWWAVAPRTAAVAVYVGVAWSALVDLLLPMVAGPTADVVERASIFHYVALAPAEPLQPLALAACTAVGLAGALVACRTFARRDLALG